MLNNNIIDRIKLLFRKEKELYLSLYSIMGFYPRNIELYKMALSHKSVHLKNKKGKTVNNERLEFLGDAILDAIVGDIVYRHFPGKREGFLTNTRSKLVQRETLNKLAKDIGITRLIQTSGKTFSHNSYVAGNAFEALVGAMYLDRGYNLCMRFMQQRILSQMINIDTVAYKEVNFKSRLIEWTQKNKMLIHFQCIEQKKDDEGNPIFYYAVMIEGKECSRAKGFTKKESQQLASEEALTRIKKNARLLDLLFQAKKVRIEQEEQAKFDAEKESNKLTEPALKVSSIYEERGNEPVPENIKPVELPQTEQEEFDLSDISSLPKVVTQEDIIAAAEAMAFANEDKLNEP